MKDDCIIIFMMAPFLDQKLRSPLSNEANYRLQEVRCHLQWPVGGGHTNINWEGRARVYVRLSLPILERPISVNLTCLCMPLALCFSSGSQILQLGLPPSFNFCCGCIAKLRLFISSSSKNTQWKFCCSFVRNRMCSVAG